MKKLFTLLMLMVCAVGAVGAQTIFDVAADGIGNLTITSVSGVEFTFSSGSKIVDTGKSVTVLGHKFASCVAGSSNPSPGKGNIPTSGSFVKIVPSTSGQITLILHNASNKNAYFITGDKSPVTGTLTETNASWSSGTGLPSKYSGGLQVDIEAGNEYYFYIDGSKAHIMGFIFESKISPDDTSLSSLKVNGSEIVGFNKDILSYDIELPRNTTDIPLVEATPTNNKASVDIVNATSLPGTTTITVTAGEKTTIYKVNFTVADKASSDATLKSLSVNGGLVKDFNAETLSYSMEFPFGTTQVPTVTAEASSTVATVAITQATALPGTATVVVTAEDGVTTSTYTINFTVSKGSSEKELTKAMFSNGFDGFIKDNIVDGSIESSIVEAYYMEGTEVPTLKEVTVSAKATYSVNGETLTVTAEDGTTKEYTIKLEPVAPYTGLGRVFDGTESGWIKTGNSFDTAKNKGWRFSKNHDTNNTSDLSRIIEGKNRLYFFIDACNSVTLKVATGSTSARKIKVYKNGNEDASITNLPKYAEGANINIQCDPSSPCMIAIVSNQDGGDGGFGEIIVDKPAPASITLNSFGYNTYSNANTVTVTGAVAYTCTVNKETNKAVLRELGTVVPAGQGVLLKGEANGTVSFAFGGEEPVIAQNDFQPVLKATATPADKAIYVLKDNKFMKYVGATLVANKAYIELGSTSGAKALSIEFDGETTDIDGIKAAGTDDNAPVYNLQGQRVDIYTKGIIIKNGKKIINK